MRPPGPATALSFVFERLSCASDVIRSLRESPTGAELAPLTAARQAVAMETVDGFGESENIR